MAFKFAAILALSIANNPLISASDVDICSLPKDAGLCEGNEAATVVRRFYYDADSNKCKPFYYGGCGGNDNNFQRKKACLRACRPQAACPLDVKECVSGSFLSRDPENNCQFPACVCGGFENCVRYFDGCNNCNCGKNGVDACTRMGCTVPKPAKCLKCKEGYFVNSKTNKCELDPIVCTADVFTCEDGSFVSRDPLNGCAFKPCP